MSRAMIRLFLIRALFSVGIVFLLLAAAPGVHAKVFDPKTFTLDNGLKVLIHEDLHDG